MAKRRSAFSAVTATYLSAFFLCLLPLAGMQLYFAWGALCLAAVLSDRMILWSIFCLGPIGLVVFDWWDGPREDGFSWYPWSQYFYFFVAALMTFATGIVSIVRTTRHASGYPSEAISDADEPERDGADYTLWQRLWWKPASPE